MQTTARISRALMTARRHRGVVCASLSAPGAIVMATNDAMTTAHPL